MTAPGTAPEATWADVTSATRASCADDRPTDSGDAARGSTQADAGVADGAAGLRHIEPLVISPSQRLDTLAAAHVRELPRNIRVLLRLIGATDLRGAALSSYLLFVPGYTSRLVALGRADAMARREDVLRFFG